MIRLAAVGDVHFDESSAGRIANYADEISSLSDIFLLAGDLTQTGNPEEAKVLVADLKQIRVPVVAVLGNHDYHMGKEKEITAMLEAVGVSVLEGTSVEFEIAGSAVGVAGIKGFGGGYSGACASEFGELEMKEFIRYTKSGAKLLSESLRALETPYKVALLHYSPVADTLLGEKKEIYPFLGSYLLAEAVDEGHVDIAFHGHAHKGVERGITAGGVPVRNVAQPVIRHVCNIYTINKEGIAHAHNMPLKSNDASVPNLVF
ncbi:MAG: metallophosphoesterase family protein [Bdellovibrionota bacterium]